ncbi:hypothetical protein E2562_028391 [Oryza meyeriana var. granulata]|uniref:Uncharacterized protein n=1 Tax=Oryza meyeriana var. granulata TaxID=110450 RepID=A0A6G1E1X4_9ORYZ|nr:hypothetical protein E2562_028391 [Oryza meyeriana var. granulata]
MLQEDDIDAPATSDAKREAKDGGNNERVVVVGWRHWLAQIELMHGQVAAACALPPQPCTQTVGEPECYRFTLLLPMGAPA